MRYWPLVLVLLFVPLAFVRSSRPDETPALPISEAAKKPPVPTRALEEILPADAAFVLRTADWDAIRARAAESTWVALCADERAFGPLWELARALTLRIPEGLPELGQMQRAIHGGAALFLVPTRAGGFSGGLLLQPLGSEPGFETMVQELVSAVQGVASVTRERYGDVELLRVETPGEDEVVVAFATSELVAVLFGPDPLAVDELAHATVDRRRGALTGQSFADGRLRKSAPEHGAAPVLALSVDIQRMADALRPGWRRQSDAQMLEQIGLSRIGWAQATLDFGPGEALDVTLGLHVPGSSLLGALAQCLRSVPAEMVEGFPGRSLGVGVAGYDVSAAFDALRDFLRTKQPQAFQQMEMGLQLAKAQLGVDLERDVIDQITGRFASYSLRVPESEIRPLFDAVGLPPLAAQGGALFVELRDRAPVQRALEQLLVASELDTEVEEQDCDGTTVHSLAFQGVFALHWAFTERGLLVSEHESALLAGLRRDGLGGGGLARLQSALEEQDGAVAVSVVDTKTSVEALLGLVRTVLATLGAAGASDRPSSPDAASAAELFDGMLSFSLERGSERLDFRFRAR